MFNNNRDGRGEWNHEDRRSTVLGSPNYIFNVSAQMKALLDRCCGPLHRNAWDGKYGVAVVTSGGGGQEQVDRYLTCCVSCG
ncbi:MAG: flavodoxin family protein [Planctomycetes bacterium]|nr:flavodoxin family protein [Planctomycetota bacterium]